MKQIGCRLLWGVMLFLASYRKRSGDAAARRDAGRSGQC